MSPKPLALAAFGFGVSVIVARSTVPKRHRSLFERVEVESGVSANVLHAIGWKESNLNGRAIGPPNNNGTRDWGLMQINDINLTKLGLTQQTALDPELNVRAAAELLREISVVNGSWLPDVFAVYNGGASRVQSRLGGPKLTRSGSYINEPYVSDLTGRYVAVSLANALPNVEGSQ